MQVSISTDLSKQLETYLIVLNMEVEEKFRDNFRYSLKGFVSLSYSHHIEEYLAN